MAWNKRGLWYILGIVLAVILTIVRFGDFIGFFVTSFLLTLYFHRRKGEIFRKSEAFQIGVIGAGLIFAASLLVLAFQPDMLASSLPNIVGKLISRFVAISLGVMIYNILVKPKPAKIKKHAKIKKAKPGKAVPKRSLVPYIIVIIIIIIMIGLYAFWINFPPDDEFGPFREDNGGDEPAVKEYNIEFVGFQPFKCGWVPSGGLFATVAGAGSYRCVAQVTFDFHGLPLEAGTQIRVWSNNAPLDNLPDTRNFNMLAVDKDMSVTTAKFAYDKYGVEWFEERRPPCPTGGMNGLTLEIFEYSVGAKRFNFDVVIPITCG